MRNSSSDPSEDPARYSYPQDNQFSINRDSISRQSTQVNEVQNSSPTNPQRFKEMSPKWQRCIMLLIGVGVLVVLVCITLFSSLLPQEKVPCLQDGFFIWTESFNTFFKQNQNQKKIYLIIFGLMTDIMLIAQLYRWCIYGKTWRLAIALTVFYGVRFILMNLFQMRYPDGYLWEFPGFYSITVPYGMDNKFFFSAQVGLSTFCNKMAYFSIVAMACQACMLIFLRGHYIIDIFASLVFGHYFWIMAERASWLIDVKIFNLPFHKRFPNFINRCANCKYHINEWATMGEQLQIKSQNDKNQPETEFKYAELIQAQKLIR